MSNEPEKDPEKILFYAWSTDNLNDVARERLGRELTAEEMTAVKDLAVDPVNHQAVDDLFWDITEAAIRDAGMSQEMMDYDPLEKERSVKAAK